MGSNFYLFIYICIFFIFIFLKPGSKSVPHSVNWQWHSHKILAKRAAKGCSNFWKRKYGCFHGPLLNFFHIFLCKNVKNPIKHAAPWLKIYIRLWTGIEKIRISVKEQSQQVKCLRLELQWEFTYICYLYDMDFSYENDWEKKLGWWTCSRPLTLHKSTVDLNAETEKIVQNS